jgi:hypothetical protein
VAGDDDEMPISTLREAVVDGLLIEKQIIPMGRTMADALADRVMEAVELRDLTVLDRAKVAAWYGAIESNLVPLLRLRGRGEGICDVRGHHDMVVVEMTGWAWDVIVCQDCASASQVERDEDDDPCSDS